VETLERITELRKVRPGRRRMPLREVAEILNTEGRESRTGRAWSAAMVRGVGR
jgi:hypothetical protein